MASKESGIAPGPQSEQRRAGDRRTQLLRALVQGNLTPRRVDPRRASDHKLGSVDWHHPQWLAIAILIVVFSCVDALLTLMLLEHGAHEANPFMAPLVATGRTFAWVKISLTAGGVVLLTQLARLRMFGGVPVGLILYSVLVLYSALILYEFSFLSAL